MEEDSIYISLQEATKHCKYSQEYLSLRVRQGKLKAIKFGRNWVTKKEWLEEYLRKVEEYNNHPVGVRPQQIPALRFGFVAALVFVFLITGIFHNRESFKIVYEDINSQLFVTSYPIRNAISNGASQTADVGQAVTENLKGYFQWLGRQTFGAGQKIVQNYTAANNFVEQKLGGLSQSYLAANDTLEKNLSQDVDNLVTGIKSLTWNVKQLVWGARDWTWQCWQFVIRPWKEESTLVERETRPQPKEGAVVVPYPEAKLAEVKGQLEKAFSDKVEVKPDKSGRAGIIKPLIEEAAAQEYLYLIVPVSE